MTASNLTFLKGFLVGLATGLVLALIVALTIGKNNPFVASPSSPEVARDQQASPQEAPSYDFYKSLPEQEFVPLVEAPPGRPMPSYYLQTGAFLNAADAEEMRAKLALLGFEATIQMVEDAEAIRLHKVRIGPFDGMDELNKTRARLTQNSIDTLLIKVAPEKPNKETP